jgi:hypothetical protein
MCRLLMVLKGDAIRIGGVEKRDPAIVLPDIHGAPAGERFGLGVGLFVASAFGFVSVHHMPRAVEHAKPVSRHRRSWNPGFRFSTKAAMPSF